MSLREDIWKYEQITGESAEHVPIIKLGAFLDGYEMGVKALEQTRWIPCSDKQPEEKGEYLISLCIYAYGCRTTHETRIAVWNGEGWRFDTYSGVVAEYYVKAWQELPEPYREEADE